MPAIATRYMSTMGIPKNLLRARLDHELGKLATSWLLCEISSTTARRAWLIPSAARKELTFNLTTTKPEIHPKPTQTAMQTIAPSTGGSEVCSWSQIPITTDVDISAP